MSSSTPIMMLRWRPPTPWPRHCSLA